MTVPQGDGPFVVWGAELRHYRTSAGMTQGDLASRMLCSVPLVSAVERAQRIPSPDFARRCDSALSTGGALTRLRKALLTQTAIPTWFRQWREVERDASVIHWYEALVVPGLLQTEDYALALLGDDTEAVAARLDRQRILTRDDPPPAVLRCLIDESVLHRPVGDAPTMLGQLHYLTSLATSPRITLQVVPSGVYAGMQGSCALASTDGESVGYLETAIQGIVVSERRDVDAIERALECIRAESLPRRASAELIRKVAEQWT